MPGFEHYVGLLVSHEPGATPGVEHIAPGQLAFNTADQRIFARFGDDVVDITDSYSRHAVDQLLDAKASSSELAKVATTGAYADLIGKPASYPPSQHTHTLSQVTDAGSAAASDVADFEPRGSVSAAEARTVHRIDQRPDPLLMHFL